MNKETIKLDMEDYETPKAPGRPSSSCLIQQEKIARLYALADKLHVKIYQFSERGAE